MKKYTFSFIGRQNGAIGICYKIVQEYYCNSEAEACTKLWIDYEPMREVQLNNKKYVFKSENLSHKETIKNYKGLKMKRK